MLAERIDAEAPEMQAEIRRWFLDADYKMPSIENQDWDAALAEWNFVPLLTEYAEDRSNPIEKRFEALCALMLLQEFAANAADRERKSRINQEIKRVVVGDPEFARQACSDWLGGVEALVVTRILGDQIPSDVPNWMDEDARNRA